MNYAKTIVEYCQKNRVSTTEVADALGKSGVLDKVLPISTGFYKVGVVRPVFTANNSNYAVHEQVRDIQEGEVVIVFAHNCDNRAILGDLISKFILLYRGATAIVVQGLVRDVARLRRERFAVWSAGVTPLGCFNIQTEAYPADQEKKLRALYEGAIAVCDDGGVTVIPRDKVTKEMLSKLELIEMQEDIWSFCLNTLKWDTKKIVCDKAYLTETDLLSSTHLQKLKKLSHTLDAVNQNQ